VSLELVVVVVVVDGVVCGMVDELLLSLGEVDCGLVAGVELEFEFIVESAGRAAGSLVDCA
jgi:hypothetical protein